MTFEFVIERLGFAILHSLWLFSLVAICLAVLLRLLPLTDSRWRHNSCGAGLLLMAVLWSGLFVATPVGPADSLENEATPMAARANNNDRQADTSIDQSVASHQSELASLGGSFENAPHDSGAPAISLMSTDGSMSVEPSWQIPTWCYQLMAGGWLVGFVLVGSRRVLSLAGLYQFKKECRPLKDARLISFVEKVKRRIRLKVSFGLVESAQVYSPVVIGFFKPVLVFPVGFLSGLSYAQAEAVVAHELAHIKRRDYLVQTLQIMVELLLFYHPAVWWMSRKIRIEREHCCDEMAVDSGCEAIELADAIATLEQRRSQPQIALAFSEGNNSLGRVRRLFGRETRRSFRGISIPLIIGCSVVGCALVSALLWESGQVQSRQDRESSEQAPAWAIKVLNRPVEADVRPNRRVVCFGQPQWMTRFLSSHVGRSGGEFTLVQLQESMLEQEYRAICEAAEKNLKQASTIILSDFDFREDLTRDLQACLLYTSPSPRDRTRSRMPSSA